VAGVSYRAEALRICRSTWSAAGASPEPENEHDPNAVAIWNQERTLQVGYVPREMAAELAEDEQAVSSCSAWREA
jgi:hypothetical protein